MSAAPRVTLGTICALASPALAACTLMAACLDPLVSDEVRHPGLVLPAGTILAAATEDPATRAQIDRHDGVDGDRVPLRTAFAGGAQVHYWDFGPSSVAAIPLYTLAIADDEGAFETARGRFNPIGMSVFDAVPGDPGYSPWWVIVIWPVTDRYQGEVLASFDAFDEALREGLVEPSLALPMAFNCPVVLPEARLQTSLDGSTPDLEPSRAYYRGAVVSYFGFDVAVPDDGVIAHAPQYVLRREGGEPLSEPIRGVDLTRDGDLADTNDLFAAAVGDAAYTGMVEVVDTVVQDGDYIDRSGDDATSALMSAEELFGANGSPDPAKVVALYPTDVYLNRPLQHPPESP